MNQQPYRHTGLDTLNEANARMLRENHAPRQERERHYREEPDALLIDRVVFWACVAMAIALCVVGQI